MSSRFLEKAFLGLFMLVWVLATAEYAHGQTVCGDRLTFLANLKQKYQEVTAHMGLVATGAVVEIVVSPKGTWTMVVTNPQGVACIVATGTAWEAFMGEGEDQI